MGITGRTISRAVVVTTSLLSMAVHIPGQNPQNPKPPKPDEEVVRVYTDLVQTDVMVFDKQGRFVNGLKREDFQLRIDGKPQPIEFFERVAAGSANEEMQLSAARGSSPANQRE